MNASHRFRRFLPAVTIAAAALVLPRVALAQAQAVTQAPASAPGAPPSAPSAPSAAVAAVIADAQAKVKAEQFAEAVAALIAAETPAHAAGDKESLDLAVAGAQQIWGNYLISRSQFEQSLPHFEAAIAIDRASPARNAQYAKDLRRRGFAYMYLSQYNQALDSFQQALTVCRQANDETGEANSLLNLGMVYVSTSKYDKAIQYNELALPLLQKIGNRLGEASTLNGLGLCYHNLGQNKKALGYFDRSLQIAREAKNPVGEADTLANEGMAYDDLSNYVKAIELLDRALPIFRQFKNRDAEANTLNALGLSHEHLSQFGRSIEYANQAVTIFRDVHDRNGEANALTTLGIAHNDMSHYEQAIRCYEEAIAIQRTVGDRNGEAHAALDLGGVYYDLRQDQRAIDSFSQALAIYHEIGDRNGTASAQEDIGTIYNDLKQPAKAVLCFEEARSIYQENKNRNGSARVLHGLGNACLLLRQSSKGLSYYNAALTIHRDVRDRDGEALAVASIATMYYALDQSTNAIRQDEQALRLLRAIKDRSGEEKVLDTLMVILSQPADREYNPSLAIFFGKQAVNILQSVRHDIHKLGKQVQIGFLRDKENTYRDLTKLLISQGRLPEALQVLDLLKQEEYLNFSRPQPGAPNAGDLLARTADLTPRERYQELIQGRLGDALARDTSRQVELAQMTNASSEQRRQLTSISQTIAAEESSYEKSLHALSADFPRRPDSVQNRLPKTSNSRELQSALRALGHGNVALYTLVADRQVSLMLVTPEKIVAHEAPLKNSGDLDKKIVAFRAVLQDPYSDPRPLGKQLCGLLIAPIKHDLERAHAKTLLVSLDGNLRYIPLAALSPDGKHYLVETYRTALYTPAAIADLTRAPKVNWTALAMGVSEPPAGFAPLPAVPQELRSVARTSDESGSDAGMFPGVRLLDAAFTKDAMISALAKSYPLVHIASHFVFTGDETTSFLLLGDKTHLTLSALKALPEGIFAGVNLLTLSACETATGGIATASGKGSEGANSSRDIENVAVLAQRKGAEAVLASLWSVSDESTGLLMRTFYRDRKGNRGTAGETKAEALRQAQIALLMGTAKALPNTTPAIRSQILTAPPSAAGSGAPAFTPDPRKPWAHPYYWAPFILIGNEK